MNQRFLVSVVVAGKCVHSYFTDNFEDLVTIKAMYRGCLIEIFDMKHLTILTRNEVAGEIMRSGLRWKKSLESTPVEPKPVIEEVKTKMRKKLKYWKRRVLCVETGQIFDSVKECSTCVGLPYTTIVNCIKNKNATRGLHFIALANDEEPEEDNNIEQ